MAENRGRPRKIETPEQLEELTERYLAFCEEQDKPVTLTGAIRYMGLSGRPALDNYMKYEGFSEPVKKLKLAVECTYEERLHKNGPTGAIFALKNMGWSDRQDLNHSGEIKGGVMAVPTKMDPEEWAEAAKRHQHEFSRE